MAAILVLAPGADLADLRRRLTEQGIPERAVLERLGRMVVEAGPADLPCLRALPGVASATLETRGTTGTGEDPDGPGLWTRPSDAVGASWRSPVWDFAS
jgi:hypothetical protein